MTHRQHKPTKTCTVGVVYASWCPHCHSLVGKDDSEYASSDWYRIKQMLETQVHDKGTKYKVCKTESEHPDFNALKSKGIVANGFPTIYKYYNSVSPDSKSGRPENIEYYGGSRTVGEIIRWARNHANRFGTGMKFMGGKSKGRKTKRPLKSRRQMKVRPSKGKFLEFLTKMKL